MTTATHTLTLTDRELMVVLYAMAAYKQEIRKESVSASGEMDPTEFQIMDMNEAMELTNKLRNA